MNSQLKEHYEKKYEQEKSETTITDITSTSFPTTRFEAVILYFSKHFKCGRILELGAGSGNVTKALLASEIKIESYTISDFSEVRLAGLSRNLNDDRVEIKYIDVDNITSDGSEKFDAIIMIALIEHLIDPIKAMNKVKSMIKPGGFVYIDTPNIAKFSRRIKLMAGKFPATASKNEGLTKYSGEPTDLYDEGHLHYFTYRSLSLLLQERCGFSEIIWFSYPSGTLPFGKFVHNYLARIWPKMFSEIVIIAIP